MSDIANAVGVSTSAVSLALRGSPRVSAETAERIRAEALRLGYVQNRVAAGLRTARSGIIAVCLNDLSNPVFNEFLIHVEAELQAVGRTVVLSVARENVTLQAELIRSAIAHGADGLIICPARGTRGSDLDPLLRRGQDGDMLPCAILSRTLSDLSVPQFANDDFHAGRLMGNRLLDAGHRTIHFLGGGHESSTARDRLEGLQRALVERGAEPPRIMAGPTSRAFGSEALDTVLSQGAPAPGIACFSDLIAFGVLAACARAGLKPGTDLSVIGCDDMEEAAYSQPALTSIRINKAWMGRSAARSVIAVEQSAPGIERTKPELIERRSVADPL